MAAQVKAAVANTAPSTPPGSISGPDSADPAAPAAEVKRRAEVEAVLGRNTPAEQILRGYHDLAKLLVSGLAREDVGPVFNTTPTMNEVSKVAGYLAQKGVIDMDMLIRANALEKMAVSAYEKPDMITSAQAAQFQTRASSLSSALRDVLHLVSPRGSHPAQKSR